MSEHQNHTQFLRQCLLYDDSSKRHELEKTFSQLQRDLRCVRRAAWLMAMLATLAVAGLGFAVVLTDNFPYNLPPFILNLICTLAVGSLISLLAFAGLRMVYCRQLDQRREECRQLVAKLLASRLGRSAAASLPENQIQTGGTVQVAGEVTGSPVRIPSAAQG
jgi:hypothetical protein